MDEKVTAVVRVVGCEIKPHRFNSTFSANTKSGEFLQVKAIGSWGSEKGPTYPISIHFEAYPGCGFVPFIGDEITVTLSR